MPNKHYISYEYRNLEIGRKKTFGNYRLVSIRTAHNKEFWTLENSALFHELNGAKGMNVNRCEILINDNQGLERVMMYNLTLRKLRLPSVAEEIKESNNESSDSRTGCVHANVNGNLGCVPQIYYSNDRDKGYNDDDKFKLLKVNLNNVDYIPLGVAVHEINDPDNSVYPLDLMYYKLNTDEENALIKHLKKSEANTIIQAGIDEGQFGELTTQGEKLIIINSKVEFYDHNDNLIPTT